VARGCPCEEVRKEPSNVDVGMKIKPKHGVQSKQKSPASHIQAGTGERREDVGQRGRGGKRSWSEHDT